MGERCVCGHDKHGATCGGWREVNGTSYPCACLGFVAGDAPNLKRDAGKPRWDLLPVGPVRAVVRVLTWSASEDNPNRYPEGNWQQVERPRDRYYAAAMRHLTSWFDGEARDPESGESHLAHAVCSILFLLWFEARS